MAAPTVDTEFQILEADGGQEMAMQLPITGGGTGTVGVLVRNATWGYCHAGRRAHVQYASTDSADHEYQTSVDDYELLFDVPVQLSADTDHLYMEGRGTNIEVQVRAWENAAKSTELTDGAAIDGKIGLEDGTGGTGTAVFGGVTSVSLSGATGWTGDEDLILEVYIKRHTATGTGSLWGLVVKETALDPLTDLP